MHKTVLEGLVEEMLNKGIFSIAPVPMLLSWFWYAKRMTMGDYVYAIGSLTNKPSRTDFQSL